MANFPGAMNALPGVYGPTDHYFIYDDSRLIIGWSGGIWLTQGNWLDAAIALRIRVLSIPIDDKFRGWGHVRVDSNSDIYLHIIPEGAPLGSDGKIFAGKPNYEKESREAFPMLKEHYDKIKNLKAFW